MASASARVQGRVNFQLLVMHEPHPTRGG